MSGTFTLDGWIEPALDDDALLRDVRALMKSWDHLTISTRTLVTKLEKHLKCSRESVIERLPQWARYADANPNGFHREFLRAVQAKVGRDRLKEVTQQMRSTMRQALSRAGVSTKKPKKRRARRLEK